MASGAELIRKIKAEIREVDPKQVHEHLHHANGNGNGPSNGHAEPAIVDVRELHEFEEAHLPGAIHVPRGYLESRIEGKVSDRSQPVVLYCASGQRS
ncbi:MAG: sulfur-carrier protein adenylyltransferase/sulfurtransferase, partial [Thermoleophilaceae bacterium]|nr:sulfur-carrier protein adenylyltransferase/sulfurtransferase [Thermoleophilaceae bacterium]